MNSSEVMVKLNDKRIRWIINNTLSGKVSTKEAAEIYNVSQRWIQKIVNRYKQEGTYPVMNPNRRPRTYLTENQKRLIDKGFNDSYFGAKMLRHHIRNVYGENIPQNKIHQYMREKGYSIENKRKQKPRKRCRYEREYSLELLHLDFTEHEDKQVLAILDDASRDMIALGEFDNATTDNVIILFERARKELGALAQFIKEVNTDRGTQFYANKRNKNKEADHKFVEYLDSLGINHIPSRVKNPQTNGKMERWFQEYKKHRHKKNSAEEFRRWYNNRIHGALRYNRGETPQKAFIHKISPGIWLNLFYRRFE